MRIDWRKVKDREIRTNMEKKVSQSERGEEIEAKWAWTKLMRRASGIFYALFSACSLIIYTEQRVYTTFNILITLIMKLAA